MSETKKLHLASAQDLAERTGIDKDHLENTRDLTWEERKDLHLWLINNLEQIHKWTGVEPDHAYRAVELYREVSVVNFDSNVMHQDNESWREFKKTLLPQIELRVEWLQERLARGWLDVDYDDLPRQTIQAFTPEGFDAYTWMDNLGKVLAAIKAAKKHQGGKPYLPEWVNYLAGYLRHKDYKWPNFEAMMWLFGHRKNKEGEWHWKHYKGHNFDDSWDCPLMKMPRLAPYAERFVQDCE